MFVGNKNLAKFIDNLKTLTITNKYGHVINICNETLGEVSDCLRRGYKFEKMWIDLKCYVHGTKKIEEEIPEPYKRLQGGVIKYLMEKIFRKHFPLPRKVVKDTPFMKGFVRGIELAGELVKVRKAIKEVLDEK